MAVLNKMEMMATRSGFNSVVRHIKGTVSFAERLANKENLADILNTDDGTEGPDGERLAAVTRMLLSDKLGYYALSHNLEDSAANLDEVSKEIAKWKAVDLVIAYHHPDLGLVVANPKDPEQLENAGPLRKRELLVVYAGKFDKPVDDVCKKAAETAIKLLEGAKVSIPEALYTGPFTFKKKSAAKESPVKEVRKSTKTTAQKTAKGKNTSTAKQAVVAAPVQSAAARPVPASTGGARGPCRMTPMYSVVVQNELFHNGNVEAWKRIIESYKVTYPELEVYIYYDGERIMNINSLFKWGKVKHGSTIQFAVYGSDIRDVAKLQRYLMQGASNMFEAFLHGPVSTVLKLF